MKEVKLSQYLVHSVCNTLESLAPKDLGTIKSIRVTNKLLKNLRSSIKELTEKGTALSLEQSQILRKYTKRYQEESKDLDDAGKKALESSLNQEMSIELEPIAEKDKALKEESQAEVSVELSDEEHAKLKELFEDKLKDLFAKTDEVVAIADALGLE